MTSKVILDPSVNESRQQDHFFVITGCSGGGKSSLLAELRSRGHMTVIEPGREIVKEQLALGSDAMPWVEPTKFVQLMAERYLQDFVSASNLDGTVFFDRSMVEAVGYLDSVNADVREELRLVACSYANRVFLLPPWKEIYRTDNERRHTFEDAVREFDRLAPLYEQYGYEIISVPTGDLAERADFVSRIALGSD